MTMIFKELRNRLQQNFAMLAKDATHMFELLIGDTEEQVGAFKDQLWNLYLDSFPAGTNEIFRTRREYDGSYDRNFVRSIGATGFIVDGQIVTLWDFQTGDAKYQPVLDAVAAFVKSHPISDVFLANPKFATVGVDKNFEALGGGEVKEWNHFYLQLPKKFVNSTKESEATIKGNLKAIKGVFKRSLEELTEESVNVVLELIASNTLYKGEEWKGALETFRKHQRAYSKLKTEQEKDIYAWQQSLLVGGAIGKIRNHSMGTLLIDISDGMELDEAVKRWEKVVAGPNYKRPKPIYSERQLNEARQYLEENGYMPSLPRRHATLEDITANNILFVNRDSAKQIKGGDDVFADMAASLPVNAKKLSKVEEVPVDTFIKNILPTATELEVFLENKHAVGMVSLIAPQNPDAKSMFKWNNAFGWAYSGNITDSDLTQRVIEKGGRVDGVLRFSHSWNHEGMRNASLMDLHVFMPGSTQPSSSKGSKEIHDNYGNGERVGWNNRNHHRSGGTQDVDYVNAAPEGYIPVENITFPSMDKLPEGIYTFKIHNWNLRQPTKGGFKAEIAFGGQVYKFERREPMAHKEWVTLAKIELKNGEFKIIEMAENDTTPIEIWGVKTNQFVPASVVMFSPNYWDEQEGIGHRHYFFMLKNCVSDEAPNGFYNEFMKQEFDQYKRVIEALGNRMAVKEVDNQLSGVGFSSTKRDSLTVKVKGQTERVIKVLF